MILYETTCGKPRPHTGGGGGGGGAHHLYIRWNFYMTCLTSFFSFYIRRSTTRHGFRYIHRTEPVSIDGAAHTRCPNNGHRLPRLHQLHAQYSNRLHIGSSVDTNFREQDITPSMKCPIYYKECPCTEGQWLLQDCRYLCFFPLTSFFLRSRRSHIQSLALISIHRCISRLRISGQSLYMLYSTYVSFHKNHNNYICLVIFMGLWLVFYTTGLCANRYPICPATFFVCCTKFHPT